MLWGKPVGGGQGKGTDMLALWVFVALEAPVGVAIFSCLSSWFGRGIVGPRITASLLLSPLQDLSGRALPVHGSIPD